MILHAVEKTACCRDAEQAKRFSASCLVRKRPFAGLAHIDKGLDSLFLKIGQTAEFNSDPLKPIPCNYTIELYRMLLIGNIKFKRYFLTYRKICIGFYKYTDRADVDDVAVEAAVLDAACDFN